MITQVIGTSTPQQTHFLREKTSAASRLGPIGRNDLSLQVLARTEPLSHPLGAAKASDALDEAFADIAARFKVPLFLVHAFCELQSLDKNLPWYWQRRPCRGEAASAVAQKTPRPISPSRDCCL